jgi:predicted Zn finger-like uncharacterized protein
MLASCTQCGTRYNLDDKKIAGHPKVQFKCTKCGKANIVDVVPEVDQTQAVSPLPGFAQGGRSYAGEDTATATDPGLCLPVNAEISLVILSGPAKGLKYTLTKPRVVLGRGGADLELNDLGISRWHCAIEVKDNIVRLRDLESTNGIFMGDERVRVAELADQAEFRIGSTLIRVHITPK